MKTTFFLTALFCLPALAGEHTVKSEPFETSFSIDARFLPTDGSVLKIEPKQWTSFVIQGLAKHGSSVKKGDPLITFEREDFDKALAEAQSAVKSRKINLAIAQRELADLEISTPRALANEKIKFDRTEESFTYFTKTGRAIEEAQIAERLDATKRNLSYVEEELKQLLKMYEEDGVTEETEEIILTRQRSAVETARFALKRVELSTAWDLEKTIPQKAVDFKIGFDDAKLSYETALLNLPRNLEQKRLSVAKAVRDDAEADHKLEELEADAAFFTVAAPANGMVYYGEIEDGSWSLGNAPKFLVQKGAVPGDTALMTLVPTGSELALFASLNQEQRLHLPNDAVGTAEVAGIEDSAYPVTISSLDIAPRAEGNYQLALKTTLPEKSPIVGGMNAKVTLVTYKNEAALVVPKSAVTTKEGKSTVQVKMADGKDEAREVKIGRSSEDKIEILEGLTVDQVVLIPDAQ